MARNTFRPTTNAPRPRIPYPIFHPASTIAPLWSRLARIRALRFEARSGSATGWTGTGTGTVAVAQPDAATLVFEEAGTWTPALGPPTSRTPLPFRNVFRWTRLAADRLRLEHLRFGPNHPVLLFDLAPADDGAWRSVTPHVCRADRYEAALRAAPDHLALAWHIHGPAKDEHLRYRYA